MWAWDGWQNCVWHDQEKSCLLVMELSRMDLLWEGFVWSQYKIFYKWISQFLTVLSIRNPLNFTTLRQVGNHTEVSSSIVTTFESIEKKQLLIYNVLNGCLWRNLFCSMLCYMDTSGKRFLVHVTRLLDISNPLMVQGWEVSCLYW